MWELVLSAMAVVSGTFFILLRFEKLTNQDFLDPAFI